MSHRAIIVHSLCLALIQHLDERSIYLNCGPMYHMGTLMSTFATFLVAGKNVFLPRIEPETVAATISRERCTSAFLPGPVLEEIASAAETGGFSLKSLLVDEENACCARKAHRI